VQSVGTFDGKIQIQTRNAKYGKLQNGMFLKIDNNYVRKMKNHFMEFYSGPSIGCILGTNGYIWIYALGGEDAVPSPLERTLMATVRNAIVALEKSKIPIFRDTIVKVLEEQ
jgi:exosome complex RNA-binding protein Rrp4